MDKRTLRATKEVHYASATRRPGDVFEADASDAKLLVGLDKAEYVEPTATLVGEKKPQVETRAMRAEELPTPAEPKEETSEDEPSKPRRYRRRDMRADE